MAEATERNTDVEVATGASSWRAAPVRRVTAPVKSQVLIALRQAITDFELKPGERLVERTLAEQFEVSRPTVREVLAQLRSEGLVTVAPQGGAFVSVLAPSEATDIYEMRAALEALAVQRFTERATDEQRSQLREALDGYGLAVDEGLGIQEELRAKDSFYAVLYAGAASEPLTEMLTILQRRLQILRATSREIPGRPHRAFTELAAVVEAIERGDATAAAALAGHHVSMAAEAAIDRLVQMEESQQ